MLRIEVSEAGQAALPPIDVDEPVVVIGSSATARIRLPAAVAQPEHVRVEANRWRAVAPLTIDGVARDGGDIGDGVTLELGAYRVRIAASPADAVATPVQRTESLARELMRNLLGTAGAPTLEVERGPVLGAQRMLAPPESVLVIGRGDEAAWVILDNDLSRAHAEVHRGWDGVRIVDLESKNGTKVDGVAVTGDGTALRDGAVVELGKVVMRFRDPAEKHLRADLAPLVVTPPPAAPVAAPALREGSAAPFYVAVAIMLAALAGLVWIISS